MKLFPKQVLTAAAVLFLVLMLSRWYRPEGPARASNVTPGEEAKAEDGFDPYELFLLDRNYPDYQFRAKTFQRLLRASMTYDRQHAADRRGLDHPWTLEGPGNIGGRINAVAVHPDNPDILLLGYSQGGIYRTGDGGQNWIPVFDDQPSQSIASISFDPHDPSHVWVATGDVNISGFYWLGSGVYESTDSGLTWHYRGLEDTGILSKIAVDPNDPDILYVGSMGFPAQKGNERGFFRSVDGGDTWQKTLTIDDSTGIIDLVTDPIKPGRLFATSWTRIRSNKKGKTTGPGTGVYRSEDYGATWVNLTNGLPAGEHSRTSIEVTHDGTLLVSYIGDFFDIGCGEVTEDIRHIFTSFDSGQSWDSIDLSGLRAQTCSPLGGFGWYFETLKVNPANPMDMCLLGVSMFRTLDGGASWFESTPDWPVDVHADKHDLVYAHGQLYLGTDGGAYRTDIDQVTDWQDIENNPTTQYYRTTFNPHRPDWYYGGAQDNGTSGGNASTFNEWERFFGGDGFQPLFDPGEPDWMYATTQNGVVWFSDNGGFGFNWIGAGLFGTKYWDMPLVMDVAEPKILYGGSSRLFTIDMRDSVREWHVISPDLTRGDTILGSRYPAITAIAQSPVDPSRLYAGTQDGYLWTSPDGGQVWTNITDGTPGFFVTSIVCSVVEGDGVFVTFSGYRDNDHQPYIYHSQDAGVNWEAVQANLPMMGVNNLFILPQSEDQVLIIATDGGVYVTFDGGTSWNRVGNNMPYMPVYDIDFNGVEGKIIAATFSRGIMTFPLEELNPETSLEEDLGKQTLPVSVYPTIFSDQFHIEINGPGTISWPLTLTLSDLAGNTVLHRTLRDARDLQITLDGHPVSGVYLVYLSDGTRSSVHKLIAP